MLPPLLLRVRPGQLVLDMCAAPGRWGGVFYSVVRESLTTARRAAPRGRVAVQ
jgi:hypothetical protein